MNYELRLCAVEFYFELDSFSFCKKFKQRSGCCWVSLAALRPWTALCNIFGKFKPYNCCIKHWKGNCLYTLHELSQISLEIHQQLLLLARHNNMKLDDKTVLKIGAIVVAIFGLSNWIAPEQLQVRFQIKDLLFNCCPCEASSFTVSPCWPHRICCRTSFTRLQQLRATLQLRYEVSTHLTFFNLLGFLLSLQNKVVKRYWA